MRLSKRIWEHFLDDEWGTCIYQMWVDSGGVYIDVSDGIKNAKTGQDTEFVEIPDEMLLPCLKSDAPALMETPFQWIFDEKGIKWLEERIRKGGARRIELLTDYCRRWWKKSDKKIAKMKDAIARMEKRKRGKDESI